MNLHDVAPIKIGTGHGCSSKKRSGGMLLRSGGTLARVV